MAKPVALDRWGKPYRAGKPRTSASTPVMEWLERWIIWTNGLGTRKHYSPVCGDCQAELGHLAFQAARGQL